MRIRTSSAAEFQSMQTRAIMGATLWSRALGAVLILWAGFTIWLVWYRVPAEIHHQLFGRWVLCSILSDTPFLKYFTTTLPMYANGSWYNLVEFGRWLDSIYGGSFYAWCWRASAGAGAYGLGSDLLPMAAAFALIAWWWRRNPDAGHHIRGLTLMADDEFHQHVNREVS
jgi:hypothetical protein